MTRMVLNALMRPYKKEAEGGLIHRGDGNLKMEPEVGERSWGQGVGFSLEPPEGASLQDNLCNPMDGSTQASWSFTISWLLFRPLPVSGG